MRISDWSSDVCSSDLAGIGPGVGARLYHRRCRPVRNRPRWCRLRVRLRNPTPFGISGAARAGQSAGNQWRSEEHTSELQSLMRISYAVFCLKKKTKTKSNQYKVKTITHKCNQYIQLDI